MKNILLVIVFICSLTSLNADDTRHLDATFGGGDGFADLSQSANKTALDFVEQSDGKIITLQSEDGNYSLFRWHKGGTLDTTYAGGKGFTTTFFNDPANTEASIAIDTNNQVLVLGRFDHDSSDDFLHIVRYKIDGTIDTSFGNNGVVTTFAYDVNNGWQSITVYDIVIQSDGKILVSAYLRNYNGDQYTILNRYNSDGLLDTTFSGNGIASVGNAANRETHMHLNQDETIYIISAESIQSSSDNILTLYKFDSDGELDGTFSNGSAKVTILTEDSTTKFKGYVVNSDETVVVVNSFKEDDIYKTALTKYTSSGAVDTSYGADGTMVYDDIKGNNIVNVSIKEDKIILATSIYYGNGDHEVDIYFIDEDRSLDTSLGLGDEIGGIIHFPYTDRVTLQSVNEYYKNMLFKDDGKLLFSGSSGLFCLNTELGTAPTLTSTAVTEAEANSSYRYVLTGSDADGDSLVWDWTKDEYGTELKHPRWLELNKANVVTTFAGSGEANSIDGMGMSASFNNPRNLVIDSDKNIYIADTKNQKIRKITPDGNVTTFVGSGAQGSTDANGISASFNYPQGIAIDSKNNLYIADKVNHKVRKVTPDGDVTTFAGSTNAGLTNGSGTDALLNEPCEIVIDSKDNLYVIEYANHTIRKITLEGVVTTFAGTGEAGFGDSDVGTNAQFNKPLGIAIDSSDNLYVADHWNHRIRKVTPEGEVTTFAGNGISGATDATATSATFNYPSGVAVDSNDNIYITDMNNQKIRKITQAGIVSTFAGSGSQGDVVSTTIDSSFNSPFGLMIDSDNTIYMADTSNNKIKKIHTETFLSGIPAESDIGTDDVKVVFSDGSNDVEHNFQITIKEATPITVTNNINPSIITYLLN